MAGIYTDIHASDTFITASPSREEPDFVTLEVRAGSASGPGLHLVLTLRDAIKVQTELGQAVLAAQRSRAAERDGSPADF